MKGSILLNAFEIFEIRRSRYLKVGAFHVRAYRSFTINLSHSQTKKGFSFQWKSSNEVSSEKLLEKLVLAGFKEKLHSLRKVQGFFFERRFEHFRIQSHDLSVAWRNDILTTAKKPPLTTK